MSWDSKTIIDDVTEEYNSYQLPSFGDEEEIPFESLRDCSKEELQNLFFQFSQQKIYIEEIKAIRESDLHIQQGTYDQEYQIALYNISKEYKDKGIKKPTQDELKAEVVARNEQLRDMNKEIIYNKSLLTRIKGLSEKVSTKYFTTKDFLNRL